MLEEVYCPQCQQKQWSMADANYVRLFFTCWYCDKQLWEKKQMSLEAFEQREQEANKIIL
jgi:hypothetical protein